MNSVRFIECLLHARLWLRHRNTGINTESQPHFPACRLANAIFQTALFVCGMALFHEILDKSLGISVLPFFPFLSKQNISEGCYKCPFSQDAFLY